VVRHTSCRQAGAVTSCRQAGAVTSCRQAGAVRHLSAGLEVLLGVEGAEAGAHLPYRRLAEINLFAPELLGLGMMPGLCEDAHANVELCELRLPPSASRVSFPAFVLVKQVLLY
jgi:hypothetical protein